MVSNVMQLPLRLLPHEVCSFENYFFGGNEEISDVIAEFCRTKSLTYLYIWGSSGVGKSHLLMACTEQMQKPDNQVLYLPMSQLVETALPVILDSVENISLLCIDELEAISGLAEWEEAVFHCFNRLQQTGGQLLIASKFNPLTISLQLPDLKSRLGLGLVYQLKNLSDDQKQQALAKHAQYRGLTLPEEVSTYLLRRYGRDMKELMKIFQQLDKASMSEQRKLTIPFVRQILG